MTGGSPRSDKANLLANAALSLAAFLAVLIGVEITLRLTLYHFKPYAKSPGAGSVYTIETGEFKTKIRTNSLNMRDEDIPPKSSGETRVLCLGDSFTFGLGVNIPEAYPKVAGRILAAEGYRVRVINGGTGGNIREAMEFLTRPGMGFEPDVVTVQIYVGNDFYDWIGKPEYLRIFPASFAWTPEEGAKRRAGSGVLKAIKNLFRQSHWVTVEFVWSRLIQFPIIDDWLYRQGLRYDDRGIFLREYPRLEEASVGLELQALKKMKEFCDENKINLMVIVVPTKQQLFKKSFLNNEKYFYKKPNDLIRFFCEKENLTRIDFLDVYETLPLKTVRSFYYNQDRHWTVPGQAYAGRVLAEALRPKLEKGLRRP